MIDNNNKPRGTRMRTLWGGVLFALGCVVAVFAHAATLDDLKSLVESRQFESAYELGSRHPELLGEPDFDYYFGIAATDSGHAGEGLFALERCIVANPKNVAARAELARAYFMLGENQRAREEFNAVLQTKPTAAVRKTIERFIQAIEAREAGLHPGATFYLETGAGRDSNVNGGVSKANISLPIFGDVVVASSGVRKSDNFTALALGGQLTYPLSPSWTLFGGAGGDGKFNRHYSDADLLTTSLYAGVGRQADKSIYRLTMAQEIVSVGSDRYREANMLVGQWQGQIDATQALQASLHWAEFGYTGNNQLRDADYYAIGAGYRKAISHPWTPLLQVSINYGREENQRDRPDLGRNLAGARLALSGNLSPQWKLMTGVSYQESRYAAPDAFLATTRRDTYSALDFSAAYSFDPRLSLRLELLVSENKSTLELYHYRRDVAALKLRYELK